MKHIRTLKALSVVAGIMLAASCAATDPGVAVSVKTRIAADDTIKALGIEVDAQDKVVTLTGTVDTATEKERALEIARSTKGVRDVVDMIAVRTSSTTADAPSPDRTAGETIDDAGITMRVKGSLLDDPLVKGMKIDVDTRQGVVYLTGTVHSSAEKNKAISLARQAEGVLDVQADLAIETS